MNHPLDTGQLRLAGHLGAQSKPGVADCWGKELRCEVALDNRPQPLIRGVRLPHQPDDPIPQQGVGVPHGVLEELKGALVREQLVVSIVAGAKIETIAEQLLHASIVRTMPNTPAQIGEGVTAWTASSEVTENQESQVCAMLEALGKTVRVENQRQIDMATALSATGPTYIFLVMEALIDAGVHMGFSRHVAQDLVHQTMLGAVLFARESHKHPAELRNMVTSPGGTSAEAIYQMEKGSLRTVLSKAVWAAFQRAESLGKKI